MKAFDISDITDTDTQTIREYEENLTGFSKKQIKSIVVPRSVEELKVALAELRKNNMCIHITSTGKNWGMGSKQPIQSESAVVHLKKMNRIIDVNEKFRYAIIEPGVTQKQLSDHLFQNHSGLKFPVTGSAEGTSVVGNILERGVAAFGHRNEMVVALEVLLSNGEILKTGFWHYFEDNNPLAFHFPQGHGPDLRGLFTQSNMGIVTKMVIRLQPRLEGIVLTLKFKEAEVKKVTNALRKQLEKKLLDEGIVITNLNDPRTTNNKKYEYTGEWLACANFSGDQAVLKCKKNLLKKEYASLPVEFFFISSKTNPFGFHSSTFQPFIVDLVQKTPLLKKMLGDKQIKSGITLNELAHNFSILRKFHQGIPTNHSIKTMALMNDTVLKNENLDNTNTLGLSVALPAVPFDGDSVKEVCSIVKNVSEKWQVHPFHNLASMSELAFEGFYRIYFDRKDQTANKIAHQWSKELHEELRKKGYYPYRIDNKLMEEFTDKSDTYWKTVQSIKKTLDTNNMISRGKYNLS